MCACIICSRVLEACLLLNRRSRAAPSFLNIRGKTCQRRRRRRRQQRQQQQRRRRRRRRRRQSCRRAVGAPARSGHDPARRRAPTGLGAPRGILVPQSKGSRSSNLWRPVRPPISPPNSSFRELALGHGSHRTDIETEGARTADPPDQSVRLRQTAVP